MRTRRRARSLLSYFYASAVVYVDSRGDRPLGRIVQKGKVQCSTYVCIQLGTVANPTSVPPPFAPPTASSRRYDRRKVGSAERGGEGEQDERGYLTFLYSCLHCPSRGNATTCLDYRILARTIESIEKKGAERGRLKFRGQRYIPHVSLSLLALLGLCVIQKAVCSVMCVPTSFIPVVPSRAHTAPGAMCRPEASYSM